VDDFITLVVHTPERAGHLAGILSFHGVPNRLVEVDAQVDMTRKPVKVMIPPAKLPLALRIIESGEDYSSAQIMIKLAGMSGSLLIPVDFSEKSAIAITAGFELADKMGLKPVVLNAWLPKNDFRSAVDAFGDITNKAHTEDVDIDAAKAKAALGKLEDSIKKAQKTGDIRNIPFSTTLIEGVAEEVILEYCRLNSPSLVVMATRDKASKKHDLIGSVAAEVVDSCRVPVVTIPSNYTSSGWKNIENLIMFCSLDKHDIVTMRSLMKSFNYPTCNVFLTPVNDNPADSARAKLKDLKSFFMVNYPTARFHVTDVAKDLFSGVTKIIEDNNVGLLIIPNKKSNAFSRIFRPSLAHRCISEQDIPMLFIPV
jgi:nucleotide-binding universal stress UspA family protein